jgi:hypothetical protein
MTKSVRYVCQWCAEVAVTEPGLCEACKQEPDAVEFQEAADAAGIPRTQVLTVPL